MLLRFYGFEELVVGIERESKYNLFEFNLVLLKKYIYNNGYRICFILLIFVLIRIYV